MKSFRDQHPAGADSVRRVTRPGDAEAPELSASCDPVHLRSGSKGRLAVLLPSRGLIFSHALESVLREVNTTSELEVALFMTHGVPIPAAQSQLVTRAVQWDADWTWLVEEDNFHPPGTLDALLRMEAPVVACDYYNHHGSDWAVTRTVGGVDFVGFGCTLVHRDVWERIGSPYCFNGARILINADGKAVEDPDRQFNYGGQDTDFSFRCHKMGIPVKRLDGAYWRGGHLTLVKNGQPKDNHGSHRIRVD